MIRIDLEEDVALVLFEWVTRTDESEPRPPVAHPAERVALWKLEGALEQALVTPLRPNYSELLKEARERLLAKSGTPE